MLMNYLIGKKSDRFISARSSERDIKLEKFKVNDLSQTYNIKTLFTPKNKSQMKSRIPSIINDENSFSQKIYLDLLKSQIFENKSSYKKSPNASNKISYNNSNNKETFSPNKKEIIKNLTTTFNKMSSDKKINKPYSKTKNINYKIRYHQANKLLKKQLFEESTNKKKNFSSFLNLEIEEKESTLNYLRQKNIPKTAYKVLDAPNLKDDFYLHLLDWSSHNILAVGLENKLYIWNGKLFTVTLVSSLEKKMTEENDYYSSISWNYTNNYLISGTKSGIIEIYDETTLKPIKTIKSFDDRIGVISPYNTSPNIFSCGSQDMTIRTFDIREKDYPIRIYKGHKQEVCGLKWSTDDRRLASGGNDNKLFIWNSSKEEYEEKINAHVSAIKAIDWSPYRYGYLLTGGGTQDQILKLWNINNMTLIDSIDTSSQICNVAYSKISKEFISSHGYTDNYILIWDAEKMDVKATLKGHKDRVIYFSLGPDSRKVVTGAGDETIRFWEVFGVNQKSSENFKDNNIFNFCDDVR
jgi:cell division cycle 20-like protein 1 (cofactor of APC complex)